MNCLTESNVFTFGNYVPSDDRIKLMAEATMAVVRNFQHNVDVMKVEILENSDKPPGKPVFALGELSWGAFRDVEERVGKYWLWGPLKPYAAYFFGAFKHLTWECSSQLRYTLPCDGCSNCMSNRLQDVRPDQRIGSMQHSRWWHAFIPRSKPHQGNALVFSVFKEAI